MKYGEFHTSQTMGHLSYLSVNDTKLNVYETHKSLVSHWSLSHSLFYSFTSPQFQLQEGNCYTHIIDELSKIQGDEGTVPVVMLRVNQN